MGQRVRISNGGDEWQVEIDGARAEVADDGRPLTIADRGDGRLEVSGEGTRQIVAAVAGSSVWIGIDGHAIELRVEHGASAARPGSRDQDALMPPMSATVVRVDAAPGARVTAGDTLVVLEAMKMELAIRAPRDGVVRAVHCAEGQLVQPGQALVELE